MVRREWLAEAPRETEMMLKFVTGAIVQVIGMDKPERIEGSPWDGGILDEFGNMKKQAWGANVRPALSDRHGWCWLIGVPEGRNHYYDVWEKALADETGEWAGFTWKSADILPASEITSAKAELDELTYLQEYEASFLNFQGRVYYPFERSIHCSTEVAYDPRLDLIFCFDFNVSPGVAAVLQESPKLPNGTPGTAGVGEVYIPTNSNTVAVCNRLIKDWENHPGQIWCFGDATGGAGGSAKVAGSDWELIAKTLRPKFGTRLHFSVPSGNPPERTRVNSMNTRIKSGDGTVRFMVNPAKAPHLVKDFEGVRVLEGGSGEIDKDADSDLSHISDAAGYYVVRRFPVNDRGTTVQDISL
jgi:hypothetical protein